MAIAFALLAAIAFGVADFLGGSLARASNPWVIAAVAQFSGASFSAIGSLVVGGAPQRADWLWGALSGGGSALGVVCLYSALAHARMGMVAPVSAVGTALVPVVTGAAQGDRPGAVAGIGVLLCIPAIWLVSRTPSVSAQSKILCSSALVLSMISGFGFGLSFASLAQASATAGIYPVAASQFISFAAIILGATLSGKPLNLRNGWGAICIGPVTALALASFTLASREGLLSFVAAITALHPASTVILAALILKERLAQSQYLGLILGGAGVILISFGSGPI